MNTTLPPIPQIIDVLQRRIKRDAKELLQAWWLQLRPMRIHSTLVWVLGGYTVYSFQAPLWAAIEQLPPVVDGPSLILGRWKYWQQLAFTLWELGAYEELSRKLAGAIEIYNPATYLIWGRLLARQQGPIEAGMYLLLSGLYTAEESPLVERFKQSCQHMAPNQVVSRLPGSCRTRWARALFSDRVRQDFADVPCPQWWLSGIPYHELPVHEQLTR